MTYYVVRDTEDLPPSIIHEDNYFAWYNPLKKDHHVEFRGSMNRCYDFISRFHLNTSSLFPSSSQASAQGKPISFREQMPRIARNLCEIPASKKLQKVEPDLPKNAKHAPLM